MNVKELVSKMKAVNAEIEALEGKRSEAKDEARKAFYVEEIEAKNAEFAALEQKHLDIVAAEMRAKKIADLDKEPEKRDIAGKVADVNVSDGDHNEAKQELEHTEAFTTYFTAKKASEAMAVMAAKKGDRFMDSVTPNRADASGMLMPKWMREYVAPNPTGHDIAKSLLDRKAFLRGKGTNDVLVRDASGTNSGGGSLVSTMFDPMVQKYPVRLDDIPSRCYVKRAVGKDADFPKLTQSTDEAGVAVTWGNAGANSGEGTSLTESDPVHSIITINTERLGLFSYVSLKEVRVNEVGLEANLAWMYRNAASRAISKAILHGVTNAGTALTNAPKGINTNVAIAAGVNLVVRNTAGAIDYDDLISLKFGCDDGLFDQQGVYVFSAGSTGAMQYIAGLKDSSGRPVFADGLNGGWGSSMPQGIAGLGNYIHTKSNIATIGNRGDAMYGTFSGYGLCIDTDNMAVERSDDYQFGSGLITYRMILYVGGNILLHDAFALLGDASGVSSSSSS
jgi:HK97 family phage major capsid protein